MSWFWLSVLASIVWGLTYVIDEYLLRYIEPLPILFFSSLFISLILGIYLSVTHQWTSIFGKLSGNYKLMGVLSIYTLFYLMAAILILKSISAGNASLAAIIESAYPFFTLPFAYFILRETQCNWWTLLGMLLILAGLVVVQMTSEVI